MLWNSLLWNEMIQLENPKNWKAGQTHLFESTDTLPSFNTNNNINVLRSWGWAAEKNKV